MSRIFDRLGWGLAGALGLAVVALLGGVVTAGPLAPPGGPAPTQETLIFQPATGCTGFPIVLSAPGSYKFGSNIVMPAACAKDGIQVGAHNVTLDLNGFELRGVPGSFDGVDDNGGSFSGFTVTDGFIKSWGGRGVFGEDLGNVRIDNVIASLNGSSGFELTSGNLTNCKAFGNAGRGIYLELNSIIDGCSAYNNGLEGINIFNPSPVANGTIITNCSVALNGASGIVTSTAATVTNCTSNSNTGHGIFVGNNSFVSGNVTFRNNLDGVHVAGNHNRIESNDSRLNTDNDFDVAGSSNYTIRNSADVAFGAPFLVTGISNFTGTVVLTEAAMNAAPNDNVNVVLP